MSVIETILLIVGIGAMNILCFLVGAKTGQKVVNNEPIEIPTPKSPIAMIKEYQQSKEEQKAEEEFKHNLDVINNYDGN